jgi:pimeloyl-ACP methyl ester carboxylesterase
MPLVSRPDGVELAWFERGEGPSILFATNFWAYRELFEDVFAELAADHRVVTFDPRGTGESTRQGPYDLETDMADLVAIAEEAGPFAIGLAMGDASPRIVLLADRHPELVDQPIVPATTPFRRALGADTDAMAASDSVLDLLKQQFTRDYRGALHRLIADGNPQMDQDAIRERIARTLEECPQEASSARLDAWVESDASDAAQRLGDRLWLLAFGGDNPWFPGSLWNLVRDLVPEARFITLEDGPISRPDLTGEVVRQAVASAHARQS